MALPIVNGTATPAFVAIAALFVVFFVVFFVVIARNQV